MNRKILLITYLIYFVSGIPWTYNNILSDALFLSFYPESWISYLFISHALTNIVLFFYLSKFLRKNILFVNEAIIAILFLGGIIFAILIPYDFFWTPFFYPIYAGLIFPAISITSYNFISSHFKTIEMKNYTARFFGIRTFSVILSAYLAPYFTIKFSPIWMLYISIFALFILLIIFVSNPNKTLFRKKKDEETEVHVLKFDLVRFILPMVVCVSTAYYFAEYFLKANLAENFTYNEIANFLSKFTAAYNLISFLLEILLVPYVIKFFGVISLFYTMPFITLLGIVTVAANPTTFVIASYTFLIYVTYRSFYLTAFEISLSPLPPKVRLATKTLEGGVLDYVGLIIASMVFMSFNLLSFSIETVRITLVIFTAIYSIYWLSLISKTSKAHFEALTKLVEITGISSKSRALGSLNDTLKQIIALKLLNSSNWKVYPLGFSLISQLDSMSEKVLSVIERKLSDPNEAMRLLAIQSIGTRRNPILEKIYIMRLVLESNLQILWELAKILSSYKSQLPSDFLEKVFSEKISPKKIYISLIILSGPQESFHYLAKNAILEGFNDPNEAIKLASIRSSGIVTVDGSQKILLNILKENGSNNVLLKETLSSISNLNLVSAIPLLLTKLSDHALAHQVSEVLIKFGELAIQPILVLIKQENSFFTLNLAIRTLTFIDGRTAENALLGLVNNSTNLIKTMCLRWGVISLKKNRKSKQFCNKIYPLIFQENQSRYELTVVLKNVDAIYLRNEIENLLLQSTHRVLYLFGLYENNSTILELVPIFKGIEGTREARYFEALELLASIASKGDLKLIFSNWEKIPRFLPKILLPSTLKGVDACLDIYLDYYYNSENKLKDQFLNKLIHLREASLFKGLPGETIFKMAKKAKLKPVKKNEIILYEGAKPDGIYIIVEGNFLVLKNGKEISILEKSNFFGELGIIENNLRMATVQAMSDGCLIHINQESSLAIIQEFPRFLRTIVRVIIRYLDK